MNRTLIISIIVGVLAATSAAALTLVLVVGASSSGSARAHDRLACAQRNIESPTTVSCTR